MTLLLGALTIGLILSLLALGVFISFRIFSSKRASSSSVSSSRAACLNFSSWVWGLSGSACCGAAAGWPDVSGLTPVALGAATGACPTT